MIGSLKLNKAYGYTYIIKMFKNEQLKNQKKHMIRHKKIIIML